MLTGEIRSQIDAIWNAFWTGGISNPLEVIEQITYLLFLRRLDDLQTLEELKAERLKKPIERRIFPEGKDPKNQAADITSYMPTSRYLCASPDLAYFRFAGPTCDLLCHTFLLCRTTHLG
jgi:hypothetical protein